MKAKFVTVALSIIFLCGGVVAFLINRNELKQNPKINKKSSEELQEETKQEVLNNSQDTKKLGGESPNLSNSFATEEYLTKRVDAAKQLDGSLILNLGPGSDRYARLSADGKSLCMSEKNGLIWSNDIISQIDGIKPQYFRGRIDSMYLYGGNFVLRAGNGFYYVDQLSGKITRSGQR